VLKTNNYTEPGFITLRTSHEIKEAVLRDLVHVAYNKKKLLELAEKNFDMTLFRDGRQPQDTGIASTPDISWISLELPRELEQA
jgi:hypothetical protein